METKEKRDKLWF